MCSIYTHGGGVYIEISTVAEISHLEIISVYCFQREGWKLEVLTKFVYNLLIFIIKSIRSGGMSWQINY